MERYHLRARIQDTQWWCRGVMMEMIMNLDEFKFVGPFLIAASVMLRFSTTDINNVDLWMIFGFMTTGLAVSSLYRTFVWKK